MDMTSRSTCVLPCECIVTPACFLLRSSPTPQMASRINMANPGWSIRKYSRRGVQDANSTTSRRGGRISLLGYGRSGSIQAIACVGTDLEARSTAQVAGAPQEEKGRCLMTLARIAGTDTGSTSSTASGLSRRLNQTQGRYSSTTSARGHQASTVRATQGVLLSNSISSLLFFRQHQMSRKT